MDSPIPTLSCVFRSLVVLCAAASPAASQDWLDTLNAGLRSDYSQARHNALKQVDTSDPKGLKVLWKVLDRRQTDPLRIDWYVREGAVEAIAEAKSPEALEEIDELFEGKATSSRRRPSSTPSSRPFVRILSIALQRARGSAKTRTADASARAITCARSADSSTSR